MHFALFFINYARSRCMHLELYLYYSRNIYYLYSSRARCMHLELHLYSSRSRCMHIELVLYSSRSRCMLHDIYNILELQQFYL